jgi:hypothetical protein
MRSRFFSCNRSCFQIFLAFLAVVWMAVPTLGRAENSCPWMNEATASDLVGGDVVGAYLVSKGSSSVCTFTQRMGMSTRTLQISVDLAADSHDSFLSIVGAQCGASAAPLQAIGNEAVTCVIDRGKAEMGEQVLGRVRDQVFVIALSTSIKNDPVLTPTALKVKIRSAAEQVAGNLF